MRNLCDMEYKDGVWTCKVCGRQVTAPEDNVVAVFCHVQPKSPSIVKQAVNYVKAVTKHIATGAETRTDEEVLSLLEICKNCDKFNVELERCDICGCKCNKKRNAFLNKLRMASQHCPENKW